MIHSSRFRKVLIIRFSSIGDIVLTSAILDPIKRAHPGIEIHYAVKEAYESTIAQIPGIDVVHLFSGSIADFGNELRKHNFDAVIDLHNNLRSRLLCNRLGRCDGRLNKLNFKKWLLVNFRLNKLPRLHIVDRYFQAAKTLSIINEKESLKFSSSPLKQAALEENLASNPFVAFSLGATHSTKRMEVEMIISLCSRINKKIVLLGGKDTDIIASHLEEELGDSKLVNLNGKLGLAETAKVVEMALGVIGFDTGVMHIASAFEKKVALIWGNTVPAFGMGPYQPNSQENIFSFERDLNCRPCSKIGHKECPKGHFRCMREQDLDQIATTVNNW